MLLFVASVLLALTVSAFCSLTEAALLSMTPSQVADLSMKYPRAGKIWRNFKRNVDRPIAFILILNTAGHTIGASVAGSQFEKLWGGDSIWLFSILFTFAMLQFTEIAPKSLGVRHNRRLAPFIAVPLETLVRLTLPVIKLVHLLNRPFRRGGGEAGRSTTQEIRALAAMARISSEISGLQEFVIRGASRIAERSVEDLLIPAEQVTFLEAGTTAEQALQSARSSAHTRFPVIEADDRDSVVGYATFKDIVRLAYDESPRAPLGRAVRPVHTVKPGDNVAETMRTFINRHVHLAVVKDAEGTTLGIVTLEDLMEELVGEVEDEHDRLPGELKKVGDGEWTVGGGVDLETLAGELGVTLDEPAGSLAGWMEGKLALPVRPGQSFREEGLEFTVRRVRGRRVHDVSIERVQE